MELAVSPRLWTPRRGRRFSSLMHICGVSTMGVQPRFWNRSFLMAGRFSLCALALSCVFGREAGAVTAAKFFAPPKKAPARSTIGGIYPLGDQIGLGLYSIAGRSKAEPTKTNMLRAAEHGFNMAGPYYGENWHDFSQIYAANAAG